MIIKIIAMDPYNYFKVRIPVWLLLIPLMWTCCHGDILFSCAPTVMHSGEVEHLWEHHCHRQPGGTVPCWDRRLVYTADFAFGQCDKFPPSLHLSLYIRNPPPSPGLLISVSHFCVLCSCGSSGWLDGGTGFTCSSTSRWNILLFCLLCSLDLLRLATNCFTRTMLPQCVKFQRTAWCPDGTWPRFSTPSSPSSGYFLDHGLKLSGTAWRSLVRLCVWPSSFQLLSSESYW